MSDLTKLTLKAAVDGLKAKEFSSAEITQAFLTAIEAANPTLNAYVEVTADKAMDMAVLHRGRPDHGRLQHAARLCPAV
jgi:aspartyl-tRNA(Asn)/glutamyl-tRNA(Gln) amidotransferase subunit A